MKEIFSILILIILLSFKSSENLTGIFYNHCTSEKIESYNFESNGQFKYHAECEYKNYGQGNYYLEHNKLILKYLTTKSKEKGRYDILKYKTETQYSDTIHLKIQDSSGQNLLCGVSIHYENSPIGSISLENGQTNIVRINNNLIIRMIGYHDLIIEKGEIFDNSILGFNVFLQNWNINFIENVNDSLTFRIINTDSILIDNCLFVRNIKSNRIVICE